MEAILVVFIMIFVLMVLIPRCRKNSAADTTPVVAPVPTPQVLPTAPATETAAAPATEVATTTAAAPVAPVAQPAVVAPAPVAATEKISTPEAFAKKLTPKPMTTKTQRAAPSSNGETTVPFNPDGGGTAESGNGGTLYTIIGDVKMRAQPGLDGKVIGKLPKDAAVTYLNVRTDKTQKLTIENVPNDEPWLKVRTKRGTIGWVYGGVLKPYKK